MTSPEHLAECSRQYPDCLISDCKCWCHDDGPNRLVNASGIPGSMAVYIEQPGQVDGDHMTPTSARDLTEFIAQLQAENSRLQRGVDDAALVINQQASRALSAENALAARVAEVARVEGEVERLTARDDANHQTWREMAQYWQGRTEAAESALEAMRAALEAIAGTLEPCSDTEGAYCAVAANAVDLTRAALNPLPPEQAAGA